MAQSIIKEYYHLTKPGIIRGNVLTAIAGFLLASRGTIDWWLFLATIAGVALIIASACVFNNYLDRFIDVRMGRTEKRALATGAISHRAALVFASMLGGIGFVILGFYTNLLTLILGVIAYVTYIVLYGIAKRASVHGTLVGAIAGALPPVAGYTAVTGSLDGAALYVFALVALWQMPHFYAIAIYRLGDYTAAKIPVLPAVKGIRRTKIEIIVYMIALIVCAPLLTVSGYTGLTFAVTMIAITCAWLLFALCSIRKKEAAAWARSVFFFSLIVILVFSAALSFGALLP